MANLVIVITQLVIAKMDLLSLIVLVCNTNRIHFIIETIDRVIWVLTIVQAYSFNSFLIEILSLMTNNKTSETGCEDNWPTKKCSKKCNAKKCRKTKSCKKNCRNTCDLCGIEEPCEDQKSSKFCKKQLKKGKCSQSSVWKKCKKTCDAC